MKLIISPLMEEKFTIEIDDNSSILELQSKIQEKNSVHPHYQRLIHAGIRLEEPKFLKNYKLKNNDTIHLVTRLRYDIPEVHRCIFCENNYSSEACIPCGHLCLCRDCIEDFEMDKCPICNIDIKEMLHIQYY